MRIHTVLKKLDDFAKQLQEWGLIFTATAMVLLTFWQVIARYVLALSVPYAEEIARLMIVWCIFIGGALATRKSEHVRVEAFLNMMPKAFRIFFEVLSYVLIIIFACVMIIYGGKYVVQIWEDRSTSLGYSRGWFFLPNIISGVFIAVYAATNLISYICKCFLKSDHTEGDA